MDAAHIHLLLNHFPILGSLFAAVILLVGVLLNDRKVNQVGLVSLVVFALLTIPAFLSGEGAEEIMEEYQGISHAAIHEHEEVAEAGLWVMIFAGAIALAGLFIQRSRPHLHRKLSIVAFAAAIAAFAIFTQVGLSGGVIRHPEIEKTTLPAPADEWDDEE